MQSPIACALKPSLSDPIPKGQPGRQPPGGGGGGAVQCSRALRFSMSIVTAARAASVHRRFNVCPIWDAVHTSTRTSHTHRSAMPVCMAAAATPNELPLGSTYLNPVSFRRLCTDNTKGSAHRAHACASVASCMHLCRLGWTGRRFIGECGSGVVRACICVCVIDWCHATTCRATGESLKRAGNRGPSLASRALGHCTWTPAAWHRAGLPSLLSAPVPSRWRRP